MQRITTTMQCRTYLAENLVETVFSAFNSQIHQQKLLISVVRELGRTAYDYPSSKWPLHWPDQIFQ